MAKTGRAVAKLQDKAKRNALAVKCGTMSALITRTKSTYADKLVAYREHQRLIKGQDYVMKDGREVCWAVNPVPRVTHISRDPDNHETATTFRGDGLPDEVTRAPKTNKERAEKDKRQSLASEHVDGWKPKRRSAKPIDPVKVMLAGM